jgi:hypothetical protein
VAREGVFKLHLFDEAYLKDNGEPVYDIVIERIACQDDQENGKVMSNIIRLDNKSTQVKVVPPPRKAVLSFHSDGSDEDILAPVKVKSCHDVLDDPLLSREQVPVPVTVVNRQDRSKVEELDEAAKNMSGQSIIQYSANMDSKQVTTELFTTDTSIIKEPVKQPELQIHESLVEKSIQSYLITRPKACIGKKRFSEQDTLFALNSFCAKLRSTPSTEVVPNTTNDSPSEQIVCRLHGLVKCGSCTASFGHYNGDMAKDDGNCDGWMRHLLTDKR